MTSSSDKQKMIADLRQEIEEAEIRNRVWKRQRFYSEVFAMAAALAAVVFAVLLVIALVCMAFA